MNTEETKALKDALHRTYVQPWGEDIERMEKADVRDCLREMENPEPNTENVARILERQYFECIPKHLQADEDEVRASFYEAAAYCDELVPIDEYLGECIKGEFTGQHIVISGLPPHHGVKLEAEDGSVFYGKADENGFVDLKLT